MDTRAVNTVFRQTRIIEVAVSGSAQEIAIHQQKFDLYMNEHPNVTIKPVDLGSERFQKLMTLIGADNAPDIIYLNEWTYVMANKGVLLGLNDLIEKDQFDTSVYPESLLTPLRYENELYALPQEVSPFVIYYNKEMFEAANVPLPTDDWTIDEFYAAAEALTNPAEKVYGYRHPGAWADQVLGWLSRAGVDFDISGTEVKGLDTPEALNALTFLHNLVVKDELSPNPAALLNQKIRGVNAYRSAFSSRLLYRMSQLQWFGSDCIMKIMCICLSRLRGLFILETLFLYLIHHFGTTHYMLNGSLRICTIEF